MNCLALCMSGFIFQITIEFYKNFFNMRLLRASDYSDFSLYFLATPSSDVEAKLSKLTEDTARDLVSARSNWQLSSC